MQSRVTIATTKSVEGLQTFSLDNLKELSNFTEVNVVNPNTREVLGVATRPKLTRLGEFDTKLSVLVNLHTSYTPELRNFSVAYRIGNLHTTDTNITRSDLTLMAVILVGQALHD